MPTKKNHTYIIAVLAIVFGLSAVSYLFKDFFDVFGIFGSLDSLKDWISQFGTLAPLVMIILVTLEVIIAPLPGGFLPIAAGALFGPFLGTAYSWLGNVLGSIIAFGIARKYGTQIIRFFVPSFKEGKYDKEIEAHKEALWLMYVIPVVPVDILSFAMGASDMRFRQFVSAISIAFLARMALWNIFGDAIANILFV